MANLPKCTICGHSVQPDNDLGQLFRMTSHFEHSDKPVFESGQSTHILPVDGCPGTPWVAKYLKDQFRVDGYDQYLETIIREGYTRLTNSMFTCRPPTLPVQE